MVGLAIISLVIFTLLPLYINLQELLFERRNEVEMWRFSQDFTMQKLAEKKLAPPGQRSSNNKVYSAIWNDQEHSLTILDNGKGVIYVERVSIE